MEALQAVYLSLVDGAMRAAVQRHLIDEPAFGTMLRYALGWEDEAGRPYYQPTGKRLRPLTVLLCAHAVSEEWQRALPAAAAVEILHNFSLIHDDIQDSSPLRHGRPTVWKVWGIANAINAGDAMFTLAYAALADLYATLSPQQMQRVWQRFNHTNLELTRGQHLDMRFETQANVSVDAYVSMIRGKSAALLATCAWLGCYIACGDAQRADHFASFGLNLGIAFQIHDDILGIWGDPAVTGKSIATDIASRKKSLPVLYSMSSSAAFAEAYNRPGSDEFTVSQLVRALSDTGALDYARAEEQRYYDRAMDALLAASPRPIMQPALDAFVAFLLTRQF